MSKENLRMQMLAGVITESQYKTKLKKFTILENRFNSAVSRLMLNENEGDIDLWRPYTGDIRPDQVIFNVEYYNEKEESEIGLYVAADDEKTAKSLAQNYIENEYIKGFNLSRIKKLGKFKDLEEPEKNQFKDGIIADFGLN